MKKNLLLKIFSASLVIVAVLGISNRAQFPEYKALMSESLEDTVAHSDILLNVSINLQETYSLIERPHTFYLKNREPAVRLTPHQMRLMTLTVEDKESAEWFVASNKTLEPWKFTDYFGVGHSFSVLEVELYVKGLADLDDQYLRIDTWNKPHLHFSGIPTRHMVIKTSYEEATVAEEDELQHRSFDIDSHTAETVYLLFPLMTEEVSAFQQGLLDDDHIYIDMGPLIGGNGRDHTTLYNLIINLNINGVTTYDREQRAR